MTWWTRLAYAGATAMTAMALAGCATLQVNAFLARNADFNQYRTYAWDTPGMPATGDPRLDNNEFFHERLRAAVDRALAARGFEEATDRTPDLLLHYHVSIGQTIEDPPPASCTDCLRDVYDAGTLLLDLVNQQSGQLVWRGWAEGNLSGVIDNQTWMERKVDETVARILGRLPGKL